MTTRPQTLTERQSKTPTASTAPRRPFTRRRIANGLIAFGCALAFTQSVADDALQQFLDSGLLQQGETIEFPSGEPITNFQDHFHPIPIGDPQDPDYTIERVGQGTHCDPRIAEYIAEATAYSQCPAYTGPGDCDTWYSTYNLTHACPNWTNPNQTLSGIGAQHTVTVVCECIPQDVVCTPSYGGVVCKPQ